MENSRGSEKARLTLDLIDKCPENVHSVDLINQIFTNEESLSEIDDCLALMDEKLGELDAEITIGLREAADMAQKREETTVDIRAVKSATQLLTDEIKGISKRVRQTREVTDEIAKEIYFLDRGRENINFVIGCLQRLLMLQSGLKNLRKFAAERQYRKCTDLIKATDSLAQFFTDGDDSSRSIPQVRSLLDEKEVLFNDLKRQISDELETAIEDCDVFDRLQDNLCKDCCLAADAIYPNLKNEMLMKVALKILEPYKRNFAFMPSSVKKDERKKDAANALQGTDKRQLWLKRCLEDCRQPFEKMFPDEWKFEHFICQQFALMTRQHVISLLEICSDILDPPTLINIMQRMKDLERFLEQSATEKGMENKLSTSGSSFKGSITRIFDSFLSGWYMQKDADFYNLLTAAANEPDEVTSLCDNNVISPTDSNGFPKRVYKLCLDLFKELKIVHSEAQSVDSIQMNRDVFKLARKSMSMYLDVLSVSKRPTPLINLLNNREKNITLLLAKYICTNVLQICSTNGVHGVLKGDFQTEVSYSDNRSSKSAPWMPTLLRDKKVKLKYPKEIDDFGDLATVISTLYFMEESLPAMEIMLQRDLANDATNANNLSCEMDRTWELRHTYFYLCCMHFIVSVVEPEISVKYLDWRKRQVNNPLQPVESRNPYIDSFLNVWVDWIGLVSQYLPDGLVQFLFDCCITLLVAELTHLLCTQLPPFDSTSLTSQLLLDLSFLADSLSAKFPTLYVDVAKCQLQSITTALKIIASSQSEKKVDSQYELQADDSDLESSDDWRAVLDATAHYKVIWEGFVESTTFGHNRRDPLFAELLKVMVTGNHFCPIKPSEIQTVTKILSLKMEKLKWNMAIFDVQ